MEPIDLEAALTMVGAGWDPLVELAYKLKPENVSIIQVKEKFGALRIYTNQLLRDHYEEFLTGLEDLSKHICEKCGMPGETRTDRSWYLTLCDDCA